MQYPINILHYAPGQKYMCNCYFKILKALKVIFSNYTILKDEVNIWFLVILMQIPDTTQW